MISPAGGMIRDYLGRFAGGLNTRRHARNERQEHATGSRGCAGGRAEAPAELSSCQTGLDCRLPGHELSTSASANDKHRNAVTRQRRLHRGHPFIKLKAADHSGQTHRQLLLLHSLAGTPLAAFILDTRLSAGWDTIAQKMPAM